MRAPILALFFLLYTPLAFAQLAFSDAMMADPRKYSREFEAFFVYKELPVYTKNMKERSVFLKNGYASSVLQTPIQWPLKLKQYYVKEVKVIFTKYPVDKSFWNTNYYELLAARLQTAFALDPKLNDARISYSLVLQTGCKSEKDAKLMMHAIEIVYELGERKKQEQVEELDFIDSLYLNADSLAWAKDMEKANKFFKKSKATDTVVL